MNIANQRGATIIELLISVVIGLVIAAGMLGMYVTSTANSSSLIKSSKLNQEMTTLMTVIVNDIRRAGFWATTNFDDPQLNPFSAPGNTVLTVVDQATNSAIVMPGDSGTPGDCVLYAYESDPADIGDGTASNPNEIEAADIHGFRLSADGEVQMRTQGNKDSTDNDECTVGTWLSLTDKDYVVVDTLEFYLDNSECLNASEPDNVEDGGSAVIDDDREFDCYDVPPGSGDIRVVTREISIKLAGYLADDTSVRLELNQDVRIRNDFIVTP